MFPEDIQSIYARIAERWPNVVFTGSRAIGCAQEDSDWDFVVYECFPFDAQSIGLVTGGDVSLTKRMLEHPPQFTSLRIGNVNLIVDHRGEDVLANWAAATDYCLENRVFDKQERIKVFDSFGAG